MDTYCQIIDASNYTFQQKEEWRYKARIQGLHYTTCTEQIKQKPHLHRHAALHMSNIICQQSLLMFSLYTQLLQKEYKCIKCAKQHASKYCLNGNGLDKPIFKECKGALTRQIIKVAKINDSIQINHGTSNKISNQEWISSKHIKQINSITRYTDTRLIQLLLQQVKPIDALISS
ncbi:hypothetical protein HZH66_013398 [Vespula vulgaris]|uniref:Uncharacterized protein n=1 Tax=Vespula vulgaris TaxID=7454 RepID=A0A834JCF9_VESVU|nr:hypothetical protein HZH66_013398 [Vespula vulgaris]